VHESAEVLGTEHTAEGTRLHARVDPGLAAMLEPFSTAR
jgi:GTP-binding protein HflX